MADLEAVARWCDGKAVESERFDMVPDLIESARMYRAASAACREVMRHRGFMYNVTEISDASAATDAALNAIKEAR